MTSTTTVVGNLTNDPDLVYGQNGKPRAGFSIAVNHSRRNGDQFEEIGTTFIRVTLWDYHAEQAAEYMQKGDRVIATGHFVTREFQKQDGEKGASFEMQVQDIGKVLRKRAPKDQQNAPQGYGGGQATQQPQSDPWGGQPSSGGGWNAPVEQPAAWDQQQGDQGPIPF